MPQGPTNFRDSLEDHRRCDVGRFGTPIDPRNFLRSFTNTLRAAGLRKITVHDARRTCSSLLVDLDVHPRVIMAIMRHSDFKVTMEVYAQASDKATREALRRLGERLGSDDQRCCK